jgi:enoyl-CoA hydratase/carnithine racemase
MAEPVNDIRYDTHGQIVVITLDRPDHRNAVTREIFLGITEGVARAETEGARALVLAGAGSYFCAGLDLKSLESAAGAEQEVFGEVLQAGNRMIAAFGSTPLPSVSAVQGGAVGGGLGLALSTDLCITGCSATFSTQYIKVGMTPDVGVSFHLTRRLGPARASSMLLRSPVVRAESALAMGLVDDVVEDEEVLETAVRVAGELARRSPTAINGIRSLTSSAFSHDLNEHLAEEQDWIHRCWADPTAQRYAQAFKDRSIDPTAWAATSGLSSGA